MKPQSLQVLNENKSSTVQFVIMNSVGLVSGGIVQVCTRPYEHLGACDALIAKRAKRAKAGVVLEVKRRQADGICE